MRNFEEVNDIECQGLGGEKEDVMYGETTVIVDFQTIKLPIKFYVMKKETSLPSSILGFIFFITHSCNFIKDEKPGKYTMSILNYHTIPLEFNTLPRAINVVQTTPMSKEIFAEGKEIKIINTDCIPLEDQIVPNPLLKKNSKLPKKATEK